MAWLLGALADINPIVGMLFVAGAFVVVLVVIEIVAPKR